MPPDSIPLHQLRRVLVVKLRHHGDVLLTSPLLATLKQHAPQAEIDALVYADAKTRAWLPNGACFSSSGNVITIW